MKPRLITTKKLLVGLIVAATGAANGPGLAQASTLRPHRDAAGYPLVGNLIRKGSAPAPSPPPESEASAELLQLREALVKQSAKEALAQMKRFRPLCDKAGYPLVGNLIRKERMEIQPSTFCLEVRTSEVSKT